MAGTVINKHPAKTHSEHVCQLEPLMKFISLHKHIYVYFTGVPIYLVSSHVVNGIMYSQYFKINPFRMMYLIILSWFVLSSWPSDRALRLTYWTGQENTAERMFLKWQDFADKYPVGGRLPTPLQQPTCTTYKILIIWSTEVNVTQSFLSFAWKMSAELFNGPVISLKKTHHSRDGSRNPIHQPLLPSHIHQQPHSFPVAHALILC